MDDKIKLCLIAPVPPPYGGIANWTQLMKEHIETKQDAIDLAILNTAPKARSTDGRTLWNRVVGSGLAMIKQCKELNQIIIDENPNILHITTSGQLSIIRDILFLRIAKKKRIPSVYHIRFGRMQQIAEKNTLEWKLISRAMKLAAIVISIDNTTYKTIKNYEKKVKVVCIPNPIDISKLPKQTVKASNTVILLGWVIKSKGIEELLAAWREVYIRHSDWRLRIVGPCRNEYLEHLRNSYSFDGVIYEGEKTHVEAMQLLNESSIFILPSYTEGFPNSVLEAMALAKPIIATCVGAIPEMLSDDCGILINPQNTKDIIEALKFVFSNKKRCLEIADNANQRLTRDYNIESVFHRYTDVWRNMLG